MQSKVIALELPEESDSKQGDVTARFATLNVIDKDNDVTIPGAFESGAPVRITAYMHNNYALPVGRGQIFADQKTAVMKGQFFVDTTAGRDTWLTLKGLGTDGLQEWSYEYDTLEFEPGTMNGVPVRFLKKLKVYGVSPVYRGSGVDTTTLDIKSFADDGEDVATRLTEYVKRAKERVDIRAKEGRTLSSANRNRLASLLESMASISKDIGALLEETDPEKAAADLDALYSVFIETEAKLNGVLIPA